MRSEMGPLWRLALKYGVEPRSDKRKRKREVGM